MYFIVRLYIVFFWIKVNLILNDLYRIEDFFFLKIEHLLTYSYMIRMYLINSWVAQHNVS